jgi:tetratricopeptide (TPR) repeat protein
MTRLLCPPEIETLLSEADVNHKNEKYEEAIRLLQEAIQICPGNAVAHNNLGSALVGLSRFEEAEKEFREAIEVSMSDPYAQQPFEDAIRNLGRLTGYTSRDGNFLKRASENWKLIARAKRAAK